MGGRSHLERDGFLYIFLILSFLASPRKETLLILAIQPMRGEGIADWFR